MKKGEVQFLHVCFEYGQRCNSINSWDIGQTPSPLNVAQGDKSSKPSDSKNKLGFIIVIDSGGPRRIVDDVDIRSYDSLPCDIVVFISNCIIFYDEDVEINSMYDCIRGDGDGDEVVVDGVAGALEKDVVEGTAGDSEPCEKG